MSTDTTSLTAKASPVPAITSGEHQRQCFERKESRIRAVPRDQLINPTVDPVYAASIALRNAPKYLPLRPRMEKLAGELDLELVDSVVDLAHAVAYACGDWVPRTARGESLADLLREGLQLRDLLFSVKDICVRTGLVDGTAVTDNPRLTGSRNVSRDLTALQRFYKESAAALAGKVPVTPEQLDRAGYIAAILLEADPTQEGDPAEFTESELVKLQTFTLFMQAYDELRAGVALLRRKDGDAEEIAPSAYSGRGTGKRKESAAAEPAAPVTSAPNAPVTSGPAAGLDAAAVPVGHMGSNPFTS